MRKRRCDMCGKREVNEYHWCSYWNLWCIWNTTVERWVHVHYDPNKV